MIYTLEALFDRYLPEVEVDIRCPQRIRSALVRLHPTLGGRDLATLRRPDIAEHIAKRRKDGVRPQTINRELSVLSAAINHARLRWDWPIANPVPGMMLRMPEGRLRWLSTDDAERLLEAAYSGRSHVLGDFVQLALHTGMRAAELLGLEWHRVDMVAGLIRLDGCHTKSGRRRFVPIGGAAAAVLRRRDEFRAMHCPRSRYVFAWPDGRRVKRLWDSFQTAVRRAGIVDFRIHDLRHTFASWLVSDGVPLTEVRDLLGHASVRETERYAHLAPGRLGEAVRRLDGRIRVAGQAPAGLSGCRQS